MSEVFKLGPLNLDVVTREDSEVIVLLDRKGNDGNENPPDDNREKKEKKEKSPEDIFKGKRNVDAEYEDDGDEDSTDGERDNDGDNDGGDSDPLQLNIDPNKEDEEEHGGSSWDSGNSDGSESEDSEDSEEDDSEKRRKEFGDKLKDGDIEDDEPDFEDDEDMESDEDDVDFDDEFSDDEFSDDSGGSSGDGDSSDGDSSDGDSSDGDSSDGDSSDGDSSSGNDGGDPSDGDSSGGSSSGGDSSDGNLDDEDSDGDSSGGGKSDGNPYDGDSDDEASDGDSAFDDGDSDGDSSGDGDDGYFQKILDELQKDQSDSAKQIAQSDEIRSSKDDDGAKDTANNRDMSQDGWKVDDNARRQLQKLMNDAISAAKQKGMEDDDEGNAMLGKLGLSKLSSEFVPKDVKAWKKQLEKILDQALGITITNDPNKINKKIEDAPPGGELEVPVIKNIVLMLDCSASMGFSKFIHVCRSLDNMFKARKLTSTRFHIIPWGSGNMSGVIAKYRKVKGHRMVYEKLRVLKGDMGSTNIYTPFLFVADKIKKADAIIVFTDGEYNGSCSPDELKIIKSFINRRHKRIIWVFTPDHDFNPTLRLDPRFKSQKRYVVPKGR